MINGRQKEHVAAFNERLMLGLDFGEHYARFDIVGKPPCIEAVLQRTMDRSIQPAHLIFSHYYRPMRSG
jgi:hypothetical protein